MTEQNDHVAYIDFGDGPEAIICVVKDKEGNVTQIHREQRTVKPNETRGGEQE